MQGAQAARRVQQQFAAGLVLTWGLGAGLPVAAGQWEARTAQGLTLRITQDSYRARDAYVLERRYPDGTVDAGFGQQGGTLFTLGPDNEGPAALRLDAQGRPWVAGAAVARGDTVQAVVLRFLPQGAPDTTFGDGGRSATAPGGRSARALDLAPQADGSAFVVGTVTDRQGQERSGWWRLGPDARLDTRFGLGGLWEDEGGGSTEVLDLAAGGDGSLALGLRRSDGQATQLEAWVLAPGTRLPILLARANSVDGARLAWTNGAWRWQTGGGVLPALPARTGPATTAADPPAPPATPEAPVVVAPRPLPPAAPAASPETTAGSETAWLIAGWAALIGACALAAWALWFRRASDRR